MPTNPPDELRFGENTVVLVPGFFGFSRFGQFSYFADRVGAALTGFLRSRWGPSVSVSVVAATTVPTGKFDLRNKELVDFLQELVKRGAKRFYLVGHSTGGVDAQLLMSKAPFWRKEGWTDEEQAVRDRVVSVVTISAPHYGTALLDSDTAKFIEDPIRYRRELPRAADTIGALLKLIGKDGTQVWNLFEPGANQSMDAVQFLASILRNHELLDELEPASMARVRAATVAEERVKLTCFVTGADPHEGTRPTDDFYKKLNQLGRTTLPPVHPDVEAAVTLLQRADDHRWIRSRGASRFNLDVTTNDGIVNTARQLLHVDRLEQLGGIVVGDHADVLGHYDRYDLGQGVWTNTGLFRSGAGFGDEEFYTLYQRVAEAL